jgi:hypothetical protein
LIYVEINLINGVSVKLFSMYILSNKMGGGLMQLVAYGAQDIYLTGNPQITFFKVVYRRHTNFSMEAIQQTVNGTSTLGANATTGTVTVSRNGDLVGKVYVRANANDGTDQLTGDALVSEVVLEIGGQQIDKHTAEWMQVWSELSTPESKAAGHKYLTGGFSNTTLTGGTTGGHSQQSVMVPLQFYFCRNPGLALPLIALQYHEVKLKFTWGTLEAVSRDNSAYATAPTCEVWCDYIYLDTEERRRFAQVSHEYLIEQLQYQEESASAVSKVKLNFNHPVKELIWTNTSADITTQKAKLTLNGHDRFSEQDREYFQVRQPLDHHTAVPGYNIKETENATMLSAPLSVCQLTAGNTLHKITQSSGLVTITLAAASQTKSAKVGDIVYVEVIRTVGDEVASENAVAANKGIGRITVSAYLYVTKTTSTTIVGTLSGLDGGAADTGKVSGIITNAIDQTALGGVYTFAAVNNASNIAAGATTVAIDTQMVPVSSLLNLLIVGEQLFDEVGVDCGQFQTINGVTGTSITRAATKLDGSTASGAFTDDDDICVASELINVTIIGRAQNPQSRCSSLAKDVNVYSFALKPEEHQPSGTCNFSRIDTAHLQFSSATDSNGVLNIYAVNYNVLRVMSGMGGLAYSN